MGQKRRERSAGKLEMLKNVGSESGESLDLEDLNNSESSLDQSSASSEAESVGSASNEPPEGAETAGPGMDSVEKEETMEADEEEGGEGRERREGENNRRGEGEGSEASESQSEELLDSFAEEEAEFPDYANETNKALNREIVSKKRAIRGVDSSLEETRQRHAVLLEHFKNIEAEIRASEAVAEARRLDAEAASHQSLLQNRRLGKLRVELEHREAAGRAARERAAELQQRVFENGQRMDRLKQEIGFSEEELRQWAEAARAKETDEAVLRRYRRADGARAADLALEIEKLAGERARLSAALEGEATETRALQLELDRLASEFTVLGQDRVKSLKGWDEALSAIAEKNAKLLDIGGQMTAAKTARARQQETLDKLAEALARDRRLARQQRAELRIVEKRLFEARTKNKEIIAKLESAKAEKKTTQNRLSALTGELAASSRGLNALEAELLARTRRLAAEEAKFRREAAALAAELGAEGRLAASAASAEAALQTRRKAADEARRRVVALKAERLERQKALARLADQASVLEAEGESARAKTAALCARLAQLTAEKQRQSELLYNADYQIQLLERRAARAAGERGIEEANELAEKISKAKEEVLRASVRLQTATDALKTAGEEARTLENKLKTARDERAHLQTKIEKLNLENDMATAEVAALGKKAQELLLRRDSARLELQKLARRVLASHDSFISAENKRQQHETAASQRERETACHLVALQAEARAAETERHRVAVELQARKARVRNLQNRYETLVQSKRGRVEIAEHSQAYFVIKAAQEKEELERRQKELEAQVAKAAAEKAALRQTLEHLRLRNAKLADKQRAKGETAFERELKDKLTEQLEAIGGLIQNKKAEAEQLERSIDQDENESEAAARAQGWEPKRKSPSTPTVSLSDDKSLRSSKFGISQVSLD